MCSGGGTVGDIDLAELKFKRYKCKECDGTFKGAGKRPACPSCGSEDVELVE
jgi:Zn finger protein HypA/HybF involved in hydrogenase expression